MKIDTERVIAEVQSRCCLWDKKNKLYRNKEVREAAWFEICNELVPGFENLSEDEKLDTEKKIQQRWRTARDMYKKDKLSEFQPADSNAKKRKKYAYHNILTFLDSVIHTVPYESLSEFYNYQMPQSPPALEASPSTSAPAYQSTTETPSTSASAIEPIPASWRATIESREAKIQWKKLRDSHREALRRRKPSSGPSALNLKPWKYEEDMKFLSQTEATKEQALFSNDSNDTQDSGDNSADNNRTSEVSIPESVLPIQYSDPLNSTPDLREERMRERRDMRMREIDSHRDDGLSKLFDSFYHKTRELPKYLQLRVQREIFASISRAEEEALSLNPENLVGYSLASSSSHGYNNSSSIDKDTDYSTTEYETKYIRRSIDN